MSLFSGMGYTLEAHPTVTGTSNRPDFLVLARGEPIFYLEATVAGLPSQEDAGGEARLAEVLDLVNKLNNPNFLLEVSYRGLPGTPPPGRELLPGLEAWLGSLDVDEIGTAWKGNNFDDLPRFEWSHDGLTLFFAPIPRSPRAGNARTVAIRMGEGHWITPDEDIRGSIRRKAKKYGELPLPLIVAVNFLGEHCDDTDVNNALFGTETIRVCSRPNGSYDWAQGRRKPNGVWFARKGPRNQSLRAVLIANHMNPYTAGTTTPMLIHNPYAEGPLNLPGYPLPQSVLDEAKKTMQRIEGGNAIEFLRLPSPWPPARG